MRPSQLFGSPFLVGIDVGTHFIKAVEVHAFSRHRFRVKGYAEVPTPEGAFDGTTVTDARALGEAIREAVKKGRIKARHAAIAVGQQVSMVRTLTFPVMPLDELKSVVALQPERYIPIAGVEEAVFDVTILPGEPDAEQMSVVLAAAPKSTVEGLMKACRTAGLKPVSLDPESLALYRTVLAIEYERKDEVCAIVDLGQERAKLSLFEGGIPVVSRVLSLSTATSAEPDGPESVEETADLFLDIRRSLEYGMSQIKGPLNRLYVTGGGAMDPYLSLSLSGYLRGFMSHRLTPNFVVEPLQHPFVRLSQAYMLAFGLSTPPSLFHESPLNLLITPKPANWRKVGLTVSAVLILVAFGFYAFWWSLSYRQLGIQREALQNLLDDYKAMQAREPELKTREAKAAKEAAAMKNLAKNQGEAGQSPVLEAVLGALPPGVSLSSIKFGADGNLELTGRAAAFQAAMAYRDALRILPGMVSVTEKLLTTSVGGETTFTFAARTERGGSQ